MAVLTLETTMCRAASVCQGRRERQSECGVQVVQNCRHPDHHLPDDVCRRDVTCIDGHIASRMKTKIAVAIRVTKTIQANMSSPVIVRYSVDSYALEKDIGTDDDILATRRILGRGRINTGRVE